MPELTLATTSPSLRNDDWNWPLAKHSLAALLATGVLWITNPVSGAFAQAPSVVGVSPGRSATVITSSGQKVTIRIGEEVDGAILVDANRDGARFVIAGQGVDVPIGASNRGGARPTAGGTIQLKADADGHFHTKGTVNGRQQIPFMVDTGATMVAISRRQADQLELRYRQGQRIAGSSANGRVEGWQIKLETLTIAGVAVRGVDVAVLDSDLHVGLLGMSFLNHFDMQRQGSTLTLRLRR